MFYKSYQSKANFFELKCQTGVYKKQAKLHKIKNINYIRGYHGYNRRQYLCVIIRGYHGYNWSQYLCVIISG